MIELFKYRPNSFNKTNKMCFIKLGLDEFSLLIKKDRLLLIALDSLLQSGILDSRDFSVLAKIQHLKTIEDFVKITEKQWRMCQGIGEKSAEKYFHIGQKLKDQLDLVNN